MSLPISVLCTVLKRRREFFDGYTLPSILANDPTQVLISDKKGNPNVIRNTLLKDSSQPYIFFCDDDIVLRADCLSTLMDALSKRKDAGVAYCDNIAFTLPGVGQCWSGSRHFVQREWDGEYVLNHPTNIRPMSLWKRSAIPRFDPKATCVPVWEALLHIAKAGGTGVLVKEPLFLEFFLDNGISNSLDSDFVGNIAYVRRKHGLA